MKKNVCILVLLLLALATKAQDSVSLYYADRIPSSPFDSSFTSNYDSLLLSQCDSISYKGCIATVLCYKNGLLTDSENFKITTYFKWNDSVMFNLYMPSQVYNKSDSFVISTIHQFGCSGFKGDLLNTAGEEQKIKNIKYKFISNPPSALVYLVPKLMWERNPLLQANNEDALSHYRIPGGVTPVWSPVQEYVYMCVFKYDTVYRWVECKPSNKNPIDSVFEDFGAK